MHQFNSTEPKITVCVVSYNQESLIEQCLQSIVSQDCDYDFEVLISDDCSTDNTKSIIKDFEQRFSNIRVLNRDKNIGALENFKQTHEAATGDFICHCDGDDYWLPGKLQKQADFLLLNPSCNIVWSRMIIKNEEQKISKADLITPDLVSKKYYRNDIIQFVAIGLHSSKMYRKMSLTYSDFPIVDYFVNVQQVQDGYAAFVSDEVFGVYRAGIGIASAGNGTRLLISKSLAYFNVKYPDSRLHISACALFLACVELKNFRVKNFIMYLLKVDIYQAYSAIKLVNSTYQQLKCFRFPKLEEE
jgi:glycosyltransferase involved in cell wall biosynthesis